jgi:hypothetical protein
MRKIIALLLICSSSLAQEKFEYSETAFTDYVVTEVNGDVKTIYSKALNWIKENYVNPDEVIKMTMDNEKIRFQGYKANFLCMGSVCSNASYTIEISFKDGKYKFDPMQLKLMNNAGSYEVPLSDLRIYYDKKGKVKKGSEEALQSLSDLFNGLNLSLKDYINGNTKKADW